MGKMRPGRPTILRPVSFARELDASGERFRRLLFRTGATFLTSALLLAGCGSSVVVLGRLDDADASVADSGSSDGVVVPEVDSCNPPPPRHRYTFDGTGTDVTDVNGGSPARILGGATLDGRGSLRLDGVDDYVDLPNGLLRGLDEVTLAVWVRHLGGPAYTRIFDIGTGSQGEDPPTGVATVGRTYLAATPSTGLTPNGLALLVSETGSAGEVHLPTTASLEGQLHSLVAVVTSTSLTLFVDGLLVARGASTVALSSIVDHNAWLGRSQYSADPYIAAEYADFRMFDRALPDCAVAALHARGADAP